MLYMYNKQYVYNVYNSNNWLPMLLDNSFCFVFFFTSPGKVTIEYTYLGYFKATFLVHFY